MSKRQIAAQRKAVQAMKHGEIDPYRICGHGTSFDDVADEAEKDLEQEEQSLVHSAEMLRPSANHIEP